MKRFGFIPCLMLLAVILFTACGSGAGGAPAATVFEMEMTESYDSADPFVNEKLFYVTDDIDTLVFDVTFQMEGESATLEIADNETGEVVWSDAWSGDVKERGFTITLDGLATEREYVIRFTGTKISHAKIVLTSQSSLVKERERPLKPDKA